MSPRTGRPKTEKPKDIRIQIRLDKETLDRLDEFAKSKSTNRSEVIRKGINMVCEQQKK